MLKLIDHSLGITEFVERIELIPPISYYDIRSKKNSLDFFLKDSCICIIFNFGDPVSIQFGDYIKEISSNQSNVFVIPNGNMYISSSLDSPELVIHIITMPSRYFEKIITFPYIHSSGIKTIFPFTSDKSKEITSEIHYNLQTLHIKHVTLQEKKLHVHGKILTILAILMRIDIVDNGWNDISKTNSLIHIKMSNVEKLLREDWNNTYSIKELAKIVGTNECYLKRDFKTIFGIPINAYRLTKKMEYAKTLLIHTGESIKSISKKLGYKYTTHFNAAYKKHHKITPGETRKLAVNEFFPVKSL